MTVRRHFQIAPGRPSQALVVLLLCTCVGALHAVAAADEVARAPILRLETGGHTAAVRRCRFSPDGTELYSAGDDKVVRVWDVETGKLKRILRVPIGPGSEGFLYALDVSPDGKWVAAAGYGAGKSGSGERDVLVYVLDARTGRLISTGAGHAQSITAVAFARDGRWLASASRDHAARVWKVAEDGTLAPDGRLLPHADEVTALAWDSSLPRLVTGARDGVVRIWDLAGTATPAPTELRGHDGGVRAVTVTPDGRFILSGGNDKSIRLWEATTGQFLRALGTQDSPVLSLAVSSDGWWVASSAGDIASERFGVSVWHIVGGTPLFFAGQGNTVFDVAWNPAQPAFFASAGGDNNPVLIFDRSNPSPRLRLQGSGAPIWDVGTAPGRVAWTQVRTDTGTPTLDHALDLSPFEPDIGAPPSARFQRAVTEQVDRKLAAPRWEEGKLEIQRSGQPSLVYALPEPHDKVESYTFLDSHTLAVGTAYSLYVVDADSARARCECVGHEGVVWSVAPYGGGEILVSGGNDQTLRFWNPATCELLLSFYYSASGEWVAWTPAGHYKSSASGDRLIGWHLNDGARGTPTFYPAAQFRASLERPEIVDLALHSGNLPSGHPTLSRALPTAAPSPPAGVARIGEILPPTAEILEPRDLSEQAGSSVIARVQLTTGSSGQPITGLTVAVNGRLVSNEGARGTKVTAPGGGTRELSLDLDPGWNVITVVARNASAESLPGVIRVRNTGGSKTAGNNKPALYVLAIGVSEYEDRALHLNFGAEDAKRVTQAFEQQRHKLFGEVYSRPLVDGDASRANIIKALEWLDHEVRAGDIAVLYLSGHGWRDDQGDYYFMPVDANADNFKINGVFWPYFTKTVSSIATHGRVVFLLDTCHAAAAVGSEPAPHARFDSTALIKELSSADVGAVVLAASSGRHVALESPDWGGGAFTRALLDGLNGGADFLHTRKVSLKALDLFLSNQVKQLTDGRQLPVSSWPITLSDFDIAQLDSQ